MKRRNFIKVLLSIPFIGYFVKKATGDYFPTPKHSECMIQGDINIMREWGKDTEFTSPNGGWCKWVRNGDMTEECYTSSSPAAAQPNEIIWERVS